jgi:propanol-preferring alcohol dehydrogenase
MRAMVLEGIGQPLVLREMDVAEPGPDEVRLRVAACGVCRTDLHVVDGELPHPLLPCVPGHEIVGVVEALGVQVSGISLGDCLGVPWLGGTCGHCRYCLAGRENLCDFPEFTGYTRPGGYASHVIARADYCLKLSSEADPIATAPLLCAGLIGWRSLRLAGPGETLGIYGFGAAGHLVAQVALAQGRRVYAFTRPGDRQAQHFARDVGVHWAGDSTHAAPEVLDAALVFAPDGKLVPRALAAVGKGGIVVCGGIHMSDLPAMPYRLLWEERHLASVANLTRSDMCEFSDWIAGHPLRVQTLSFELEQANQALAGLRAGAFDGAAVLVP